MNMSICSIEDDVKLKEIIKEALNNQGIIGELKGKLGAEIIKILNNDHPTNSNNSLPSSSEVEQTPQSQILLNLNKDNDNDDNEITIGLIFYLIDDVLQKFGLKYTSAILKNELNENAFKYFNEMKEDCKESLEILHSPNQNNQQQLPATIAAATAIKDKNIPSENSKISSPGFENLEIPKLAVRNENNPYPILFHCIKNKLPEIINGVKKRIKAKSTMRTISNEAETIVADDHE